MSVSRNVTVPVGNREPGPPSALLGNAASAHTGDPLRSIMARPNLGPGSAAYICQMAYLHGGPASVTSCDGLSRRTTAPIPKQVSKRGQRACPEICQRRDVAPAPAAGAVASLAADHVLAPDDPRAHRPGRAGRLVCRPMQARTSWPGTLLRFVRGNSEPQRQGLLELRATLSCGREAVEVGTVGNPSGVPVADRIAADGGRTVSRRRPSARLPSRDGDAVGDHAEH